MGVMQCVLYVLGQKGYQVLNAAIAGGFKEMVNLVVVGSDINVQKDFFEDIVCLCKQVGLKYRSRQDLLVKDRNYENSIAIAAGWRWLIRDSYRQVIVFHDSLLPKYRGFNPLITALLNYDTKTGVTAIIANKDFDCGDVIESRSIDLSYPTKIVHVLNAVSDLYFELSLSIFSRLRGAQYLDGVPQTESEASYSVWRDEEDYRINWASSVDSIVHFVNCLSFPYKGASTLCDGKLIRIFEVGAEPDVEIANRDAGKVLFISENKPVVICGVGLLRIDVAVDDDGQSALPFKNFRARLK